ncbi:MAG: glycosyltransferase family 9 protein [Saprospiraceae bacterium]|nr:glycosyltransferase family 9 protein [Saprospiraceae bacterium]
MKILVIRFSAMGDVVLCHPVIRELMRTHPDISMDFLTKSGLEFAMEEIPRVRTIGIKFNKGYRGFLDLIKLVRALKLHNYEAVIDLHGSIRSRLICLLLSGINGSVFRIDKGKREKKSRLGNMIAQNSNLRHHVLRYRDVFAKAGFQLTNHIATYSNYRWPVNPEINQKLQTTIENQKWSEHKKIGIAPFAKHVWKEWDKTEMLIDHLIKNNRGILIFLFGAGEAELSRMRSWQRKSPTQIILVSDYFNIKEQIHFFSKLDILLTMDSANMHLANLSEIPKIISIWGPTHPYLGFGPIDEERNVLIQESVESLSCRPCSVFGQKECHRGDHACMKRIELEELKLHLNL